MTRSVGIDIGEGFVRLAVLRAAYRKVQLEALLEEPLSSHESEEEALAACFGRIPQPDVVCCTIPGTEAFVHRLRLPPSAAKRIREVLPFELEAELPIEIDEVVFDHQVLSSGGTDALSVMAVAAREETVRRRIEWVKTATSVEPERVGVAPLELAQLARLSTKVSGDHPIIIAHIGTNTSDLCLVSSGAVEGGRTISVGISGFPEQADQLVARLKQTIFGLSSQAGRSVGRLVLTGEGARMGAMAEFLTSRLGMEVEVFGELNVEGVDELDRIRLPQFSLALATAAHGLRRVGLDLRKGPLSFERGYGFLKERAPLLAGLVAAVFLSFLLATWAEGRALESEAQALTGALEQITRDTFGKPVSDPDEAEAELAKARKSRPEDPMPYLDGFGVAVAIAETIPEAIEHDIELFDYTKGKLNLRGVVSSTDEAQQVAKSLREHRCIEETNISKISQVVNSDRERYVMEVTVHCPEDAQEEKKKKSGGRP